MVGYIFYMSNGEIWNNCYTTDQAFERDIKDYIKRNIRFVALKGPDIRLSANNGLVSDLINFDHTA